MAFIELDRASMVFQVRQQYQITLKEYLLKQMYRPQRNPKRNIEALLDVCLQIGDGERVGIIGSNGSGKSTLLRMLAGIYHPTAGACRVVGKVSSLFDLALGFEMEANGWKNIRYRGFLQGETPQSLETKIREIADFSELGSFLDLPVRYYSAGMLVRLAFSIATAIDPEILLVDEVLCAGDLHFQTKAKARMKDMMQKARIIVLVSHDLESLSHLCDRVLWFDRGCLMMDGPVSEVITAYRDHVNAKMPLAA